MSSRDARCACPRQRARVTAPSVAQRGRRARSTASSIFRPRPVCRRVTSLRHASRTLSRTTSRASSVPVQASKVTGGTSARLFEQAKSLIPGGVNSPVRAFRRVGGEPFFVDRGEGAKLYDVDGREYIDLVMSWGALLLGHAHPAVVRAVSEAAERGTSYGAPVTSEVTLAQLIVELLPSVEMVRLVNSGTEATMSAVRVARAATGRDM